MNEEVLRKLSAVTMTWNFFMGNRWPFAVQGVVNEVTATKCLRIMTEIVKVIPSLNEID